MRTPRFSRWSALTVAACILSIGPNAGATPIIAIGDGQATSRADALAAGNIQPVTGPLSDQAEAFYSDSINNPPGGINANGFQRSEVTELYTSDANVGGETFNSLVMTWNPPPNTGATSEFLGIAAWQYVYDQDPDLSNAMVHFSIGPPVNAPEIRDLSFELVDINGNVKSWFLSMPLMGWQDFWIDATGATQGLWVLQGLSPGFDIAQVIAIQFDGAAFNRIAAFPSPPPGSTQPARDWLPFNHLVVTTVPVPATLPLFGLGALALVLVRRRVG